MRARAAVQMIELVLEGSPFRRGSRHGRRFAERIRADTSAFPEGTSGQDASRIREAADYLAGLFPDVVEEIRGIAEGAGISFDRAFAFNNRGILDQSPKEACSHVAVMRDGEVVVGMNKDVTSPDVSSYFVKRVLPAKGYAFLGYGHVGRVWGYGVNEKGLCAAGTAAFPARARCVFPSVGLYLVGPVALNTCASAREAIELVMGLESVSESGNILFADEGGDAAVVEASPERKIVRRPENGVVYSTNFFASGKIEHSSDEAYLAETRARFEHIASLVKQFGSRGVDGMKRVLSAHADTGGVCRHGPTGDKTAFSWIADAGERWFLISPGPPCSTQHAEYRIA